MLLDMRVMAAVPCVRAMRLGLVTLYSTMVQGHFPGHRRFSVKFGYDSWGAPVHLFLIVVVVFLVVFLGGARASAASSSLPSPYVLG